MRTVCRSRLTRALATVASLGLCIGGCSSGGGTAASEDGGIGGSGGVNAEAGPADSGGRPDARPETNLPRFLSETGLYADISTEELSPDVQWYEPQWLLWSDGATKDRWLRLPPGQKIDSSDMSFWSFPVGTQVWKDFTRDSVRVETRLLEKTAADTWEMVAYQWNDSQSEAEAVPAGVDDASGTPHDVPSSRQCDTCHGAMNGDVVTSVSALMLSHAGAGMNLTTLSDDDLLTDPPAADFQIPGDAAAVAAIGYMHANCGICHNPTSAIFTTVDMALWQDVTQLGSVEETTTWQTAVGVRQSTGGADRIEPGNPDLSALVARLSTRGLIGMPPLGTEDVDQTGIDVVRSWISSLSVDGGVVDGGVPDAGDGG